MDVKRISFLVTFWGKVFREYFEDYCLASLFNTTALADMKAYTDKVDIEVVVCSPGDDWEDFRKSKRYAALSGNVQFKHLDLTENTSCGKTIMHKMTYAHELLGCYCMEHDRIGSYLYPESIMSSHYLLMLIHYALKYEKYSFVTYVSTRMSDENIIENIEAFREKDDFINISNYDLAKVSQATLHHETARSDLSKCYDIQGHAYYYFRINTWKALAFFTLNWAPILVNYPQIKHAHTSPFDTDIFTIDGNYVDVNSSDDYPVITIRDNCFGHIVGFTDTRMSKGGVFQGKSYVSGSKLDQFILNVYRIGERLKRFDVDKHKHEEFINPVILYERKPLLITKWIAKAYAKLFGIAFRLATRCIDRVPQKRRDKACNMTGEFEIITKNSTEAYIDTQTVYRSKGIYTGKLIEFKQKANKAIGTYLQTKPTYFNLKISIPNIDLIKEDGVLAVFGVFMTPANEDLDPLSSSLQICGDGCIKIGDENLSKMEPIQSKDQLELTFDSFGVHLIRNDTTVIYVPYERLGKVDLNDIQIFVQACGGGYGSPIFKVVSSGERPSQAQDLQLESYDDIFQTIGWSRYYFSSM